MGMRNSGALSLGEMSSAGVDLVWVESQGELQFAWTLSLSGIGRLPPCGNLIPESAFASPGTDFLPHTILGVMPSMTRVPVVTPCGKKHGKLPPRIEVDYLPPI